MGVRGPGPIIAACSRYDEYNWFFRPRLADSCAMSSFLPALRSVTAAIGSKLTSP